MLRANAMTIGQLSQCTGVPIKVLREYERLGFLYTRGRSASNYRLFGDEALWCVRVIQGLRSLGLTLKEIQDLVTQYLERPNERGDGLLHEHLQQALARVEGRIASLQALRQRILDFEATCAGTHTAPSELTRFFGPDPHRSATTCAS
jgi:MerR family transcriptional regulator, copper efflux regulator